MITKILKTIITDVKVIFNGLLQIGGGNYIGFNVKFINRGSIRLYGNVTIRPSSHVYVSKANSLIEIGEGTEIGNHSTISAHNTIIFEQNVLTGPHVFISDHNHEYKNPTIAICKQGVSCSENSKVVIGEGSWIGTNAVIVGNVLIGKHCVIGANSVVTKNIPDFSVAAGIPCKVIKRYNFEKKEWVKV